MRLSLGAEAARPLSPGAALSRAVATHRAIIVVALSALALRVLALVVQGPVAPDWDGADYVRIGQNLHDGLGNVQLRGVPNVMHAPLYSSLIAALLFVVRSPELAGIAISVASGTLLVVSMHRLTSAIAGPRVGLVAAGLAAIHPVLINASIVPLSEALFSALSVAGLDVLVRTLQRPAANRFALTGLCFGLAYLTREQGFAYVVIAAVALVIWSLRARIATPTIAVRLVALVVPFVLCATPYVAYLAHTTGHVELESKSVSNFGVAIPLSHGIGYAEAANAIGPHLEDVGVDIGPSYPFSGVVPVPTMHDRLQLALRALPVHVADITHRLGAIRNGTPLFLIFALIGAIARFRSPSRGYDCILAACVMAEFAALLTILHFWDRYVDPFVVLLLPWTAAGIVLMADLLGRAFGGVPRARVAAVSTGLAVLVAGVWFTTTTVELRRQAVDPALFRSAGSWIAENGPSRPMVMDVDPLAAYYGGGIWRTLPYTDSSTALRYIASRRPNYIVIGTRYADRPYIHQWLTAGIPDPRAQRVFSEKSQSGQEIDVYRWAGGISSAAPAAKA